MNEVLSMLKECRKVLSREERWTQGTTARDSSGRPVAAYFPEAVCWCSHGILVRFLTKYTSATYGKCTKLLQEACGGGYVQFNDNHSHHAVMRMWDVAVELAGKGE